MKFFAKIKDKFAHLVAPTSFKCLCCGRDVFDQLGFCPDCLKQVSFNNGKTCKRCGVGIDGAEDYCTSCAFEKVYFDRAYSAFSYEGAVRKAIVSMKFYNMASYAKVLARYLVFVAQKNDIQFDLVCYAPMTKRAQKQRRYNQAQLLATHFCDILNKDDALCHALTKVRETDRQEQLNKNQRKENLIGSYRINADVKGKRVVVIDDIKTTGATLNECAKVLKRAGAISVVGITVASRKENALLEMEETQ